jgi:3-oxoacyl-[acyl-carrier-protein] synthase-3
LRIAALGVALPGRPVTNDDMAERLGIPKKWLDQFTGNRERYFCDLSSPDGVPRSTSELAATACSQALTRAEVDPASIEFLILATATPDHLMPATVNLVADSLGLDGIATFQIMSGCAGAIQGLFMARALLQSGSRRGLVVGADTCLKAWPSARELHSMRPAEAINFALFGDGGGAAVVDADDEGEGLLVRHMFVRFEGLNRKPGQYVRWFGAEGAPLLAGPDGRESPQPMGEEDYKAIEANVPRLAEQIITELLKHTGDTLDDVEHVLVPQLNGLMTEKIREHVGVRPDQAVSCVAETGNNGNALPMIQLDRLVERLDGGTGVGGRALVSTVESSKWIVSGMALDHQPAPALVGGRSG